MGWGSHWRPNENMWGGNASRPTSLEREVINRRKETFRDFPSPPMADDLINPGILGWNRCFCHGRLK